MGPCILISQSEMVQMHDKCDRFGSFVFSALNQSAKLRIIFQIELI